MVFDRAGVGLGIAGRGRAWRQRHAVARHTAEQYRWLGNGLNVVSHTGQHAVAGSSRDGEVEGSGAGSAGMGLAPIR